MNRELWTKALLDDPSLTTMLVYADWLEENGKEKDAKRWRENVSKKPFRYYDYVKQPSIEGWENGHGWWCSDRKDRGSNPRYDLPPHADVSWELFEYWTVKIRLSFTVSYWAIIEKTQQEAIDLFIRINLELDT